VNNGRYVSARTTGHRVVSIFATAYYVIKAWCRYSNNPHTMKDILSIYSANVMVHIICNKLCETKVVWRQAINISMLNNRLFEVN